MGRQEFIEILNFNNYSYSIVDDKIVVDCKGKVALPDLVEIPEGVIFSNDGDVILHALRNISPDTVFENGLDVALTSIELIPSGVVFSNENDVHLDCVESIETGVEFKNDGDVYLGNYDLYPSSWFSNWNNNIKSISSNKLLNIMVKRGLFL